MEGQDRSNTAGCCLRGFGIFRQAGFNNKESGGSLCLPLDAKE